MLPLRAIGRGLARRCHRHDRHDLVWYVRYRRGGGKSDFLSWEFSVGLDRGQGVGAGEVGKLRTRRFTHQELPARYAALTNNVMHWLYGVGWGGLFGCPLARSALPRLRQGPLLGACSGWPARGHAYCRFLSADLGVRSEDAVG